MNRAELNRKGLTRIRLKDGRLATLTKEAAANPAFINDLNKSDVRAILNGTNAAPERRGIMNTK